MDEPNIEDDDLVGAAQAEVERVILSHAPECADVLREIHEYWSDELPIGPSQLLLEFGNRYLLPELGRQRHVSDGIRKVFDAVEELLANGEEFIAESAYFGCVESLGELVNYVEPQGVGWRVAYEIKSTYPAWHGDPLNSRH